MATKKVTQEQASEAMKLFINASCALQMHETHKKADLAEVEQKYSFDIQTCQGQVDEATKVLEAYAVQNRESLLGDKKSADFEGGKFGFRLGNKKLVLLNGNKWTDVLEAAKKTLSKYVRKVDELEKDRLVKEAEAIGAEKLEAIGVKVEQEEKFFVTI